MTPHVVMLVLWCIVLTASIFGLALKRIEPLGVTLGVAMIALVLLVTRAVLP